MEHYITFQDDYLGIFTRSYLWQTAHCNVFIDGGLCSGADRKRPYLADGRPATLLLSHGHWDHIGCDGLTQQLGGRVLVHRGDERHVSDYDWHWQGLFGQFAQDFDLPPQRHDVFWSQVGQPVTPDGFLEDGQILTFDDARFRVIAIPGHSNGSVCFLEENSGVLFSGDGIIGDGFFGGTPQICDFDAYLASMEKLKGLAPRLVVTAHTQPVEGRDFLALLQRSIDCAHRMLGAAEAYAASERGALRLGDAAKVIADGEGKRVGGGTCVSALAALGCMHDSRGRECAGRYLGGV